MKSILDKWSKKRTVAPEVSSVRDRFSGRRAASGKKWGTKIYIGPDTEGYHWWFDVKGDIMEQNFLMANESSFGADPEDDEAVEGYYDDADDAITSNKHIIENKELFRKINYISKKHLGTVYQSPKDSDAAWIHIADSKESLRAKKFIARMYVAEDFSEDWKDEAGSMLRTIYPETVWYDWVDGSEVDMGLPEVKPKEDW